MSHHDFHTSTEATGFNILTDFQSVMPDVLKAKKNGEMSVDQSALKFIGQRHY